MGWEDNKNEFIEVYQSKIHREGADKLLDYLKSQSDFFTAPASAKYHCAFEGGLCAHSLNVYDCLCDYLDRARVKTEYNMNPSEESVAIVALLHDLCKIGCYKTSFRNVKNKDTGVWESVPYYEFDDSLPYGHGEKSVYIISGYMKLTREEAFAIRYHMGFSKEGDVRDVGKVFEMFPLAYALNVADSEAAFFIEGGTK